MSTTGAKRNRSTLVALAAVFALILAGLLAVFAPSTVATARLRAGNGVGVIASPATALIGPTNTVLPGQRRARAPAYDLTASGSSVAAEEGPALFRGTSESYVGSPALQRIGITPASTDPAVAATYATHAEQFGSGVLQIASPADLAGVKLYPGNVLGGLESEVGVGLTPAEFAARASGSVSAAEARGILGGMGIDIPGAIYGNTDVLDVFRSLQPMGPEQIQSFLEAAGGSG